MNDGTTKPQVGETFVNPLNTASGVGIVAGNAGSNAPSTSPVPAYKTHETMPLTEFNLTHCKDHERPSDRMEHGATLESTHFAAEVMGRVFYILSSYYLTIL